MKKSKYVILGFTISFVLFFVIGIILNYVDANSKIKVKKIDNFDVKISSINENIEKIKNEDCRESLKLLSDKIKDTYYESDVSIKTYVNNYFYIENYSYNDFYSLYLNTKDICDYKNDSIDELVIASTSYPRSLKSRLDSNYEIDFKDFFNRKKINENNDEVGTYSSKILELRSINEYVNGVIKNEKNL